MELTDRGRASPAHEYLVEIWGLRHRTDDPTVAGTAATFDEHIAGLRASGHSWRDITRELVGRQMPSVPSDVTLAGWYDEAATDRWATTTT